ncbi:hypothetical protein ANN_11603 [Periplaneta americana]|uniref:Reverse transcriptase n=1 Tax=Periplaneta americana TaxID=6978 RepID=A0ABQ8T5H2_PERAM|nr:hypothetical protein ANN_11603 [Periplaneta americana]
MTANLAAVRSVPGRSLDGTRCRHGCPEIETLTHVLRFCEQGLLLRNSRHHLIRSKIAAALRNKGWIVEEEISCLAKNGSTRRVGIIAYNADTKQGIIVDPTIRFEVECHQSAEVHLEKKSIYEPTVKYFKLKYALIHVEVFGLLIGARGNIPAFFEEFRRQFALPTSLRDDIVIISLMLAGNEFQSLGRAIVKEDEYEEVRWDGIVSIVSWRERVFRLWWEESKQASLVHRSSTRVCIRNCVSIRKPEFECSGPQLEGPEFEYSGLSLKVCGSRYCELE